MMVYSPIDIINKTSKYTAYNQVLISPSFTWRYTLYKEDINYIKTYIYRSLLRKHRDSYSLGML